MRKWLEKPYHSLDYMLQDRFKEKVYKITLNGGMSCPCLLYTSPSPRDTR